MLLEKNSQGKNKTKFIEKRLNLLEENFIVTLEDWANLAGESKKLFPAGFAELLDRACKLESKYWESIQSTPQTIELIILRT